MQKAEHLSSITKIVLTALAPCKDLRDTRPCFENDLWSSSKKKKTRETSYLNFKTEKHVAPKTCLQRDKNSHPILKVNQQKDAESLSFAEARERRCSTTEVEVRPVHTQPRASCLSPAGGATNLQLERTRGSPWSWGQ